MALSEWSTTGVDTYENRTGNLVECRTTHLTTFVVVTEDRILTTVAEVETDATTATELPITSTSNSGKSLLLFSNTIMLMQFPVTAL